MAWDTRRATTPRTEGTYAFSTCGALLLLLPTSFLLSIFHYYPSIEMLKCPTTPAYYEDQIPRYSSHRSLSGCPRANKPKSRPKDGTEAEPLRYVLDRSELHN